MPGVQKGQRVPLSPARKLVGELLRHAKKVPSVPARMVLNLGPLAEARSQCSTKPSWVGMFLKAFALVCQNRPELRRCFMPYPRPHLYEHPESNCTVVVERDWAGEKTVLAAKIRGPENQPLANIDAYLKRFQTAPLETVSDFRQLMRIARQPELVRRFIFWSTLYLSGHARSKRFGTFIISSLGNMGTELVHGLAPLTSYLSFGPIAANGDVTALFVFDHRVLDGRTVARALKELGEALNGPICAELLNRARRVAA